MRKIWLVVGFYGISALVDYLMLNPLDTNEHLTNEWYWIRFEYVMNKNTNVKMHETI